MAKVLKTNVAVQENPPFGAVKVFLAGTELPEEFAGQVGNHVYEESSEYTVFNKEVPGQLPSVPVEEEVVEEKELHVPSRTAAAATWRKFATEAGVTVPKGASRDDIIKLVEDQTDITVPEDAE